MRRAAVALSCVLLALSPALAHGQSPADAAAVLQPGDQLRLMVWEQPDLSGDFDVEVNGTLGHPLFRDVTVAGVELRVIEDRIRTVLINYEKSPQFVAQPLISVIVSGEVREPGRLGVRPGTTPAMAVALAGGVTTTGRAEHSVLFRGDSEVTLDLTHPQAGAAAEPLRSGDHIVVAAKPPSVFREYVVPGVNVVSAIAVLIGLIVR